MDAPARRQPPTVRLRRLANELRRLRTDAGLTREDVTEKTAINSATMYRIEAAKVRPHTLLGARPRARHMPPKPPSKAYEYSPGSVV